MSVDAISSLLIRKWSKVKWYKAKESFKIFLPAISFVFLFLSWHSQDERRLFRENDNIIRNAKAAWSKKSHSIPTWVLSSSYLCYGLFAPVTPLQVFSILLAENCIAAKAARTPVRRITIIRMLIFPPVNGTSLNSRKGWGFKETVVCTMSLRLSIVVSS